MLPLVSMELKTFVSLTAISIWERWLWMWRALFGSRLCFLVTGHFVLIVMQGSTEMGLEMS